MPGASVVGEACDLATVEGAKALTDAEPHADILVNNLGIFDFKPFEEYADEEWLRYFDVNVMSGVRLTRAYLGGMTGAGWGRVVFVPSESGVHIPKDMIPYAMTESAQHCPRIGREPAGHRCYGQFRVAWTNAVGKPARFLRRKSAERGQDN